MRFEVQLWQEQRTREPVFYLFHTCTNIEFEVLKFQKE